MSEALDRPRELQARDLPVTGGGPPPDAPDPTAFPSLLTMENELVGFALDLVGAPETAVGTVTSGGTESCLLAVQGARDARPDVERPRMVVADTVHAAFLKGAHYFGV